jgi:hypothetical protein
MGLTATRTKPHKIFFPKNEIQRRLEAYTVKKETPPRLKTLPPVFFAKLFNKYHTAHTSPTNFCTKSQPQC